MLRHASGVHPGIDIDGDAAFLDFFRVQHFGAHARPLNHLQMRGVVQHRLINRQATADQEIVRVNGFLHELLRGSLVQRLDSKTFRASTLKDFGMQNKGRVWENSVGIKLGKLMVQ